MSHHPLTIALARMHKEPGERRDFLPPFVEQLEKRGAYVLLEHGYGSGVGYAEEDYRKVAPLVRFVRHEEIYQQDYVLVLRCPSDDELRLMHTGACLISMLHYPTRPQRVQHLRDRKLEAISLDSIKDDSGRRLIENLRSVAWNGIETAFNVLEKTYPAFAAPHRPPIRVTLLGAGAVGSFVTGAAVRYGNDDRRAMLVRNGVAGVQVTVVDFDLTTHEGYMCDLLTRTDILVDATQRPDTSRPVIPNGWLAHLPPHAVLLDLSVDPYDCNSQPQQFKGIEGIPQGNLDQYVFAPDDTAFDRLPPCIATENRRHAVSCYSWPGIHPAECMQLYGQQLQPIMRTLLEKGGISHINPNGRFFERAITRAQLSLWKG